LSNWTIAAGALVVLAVAAVVWFVLLRRYGGQGAQVQLDAIRTAGTLVIGTGGAVALLLTARRQRYTELALVHTDRDATERRITELYTKAADQLGSEKAPVRLAGLYALERLAQNTPEQRQTIVDVICAYLRMPYTPPDEQSPAEDAPAEAHTRYENRRQEQQVRLTAQNILSHNLRIVGRLRRRWWQRTPLNVLAWPGIELELTGALLLEFSLTDCQLDCANFTRAQFIGKAYFKGARFTNGAIFEGAQFTGEAHFWAARFIGRADFVSAQFMAEADFQHTQFTGRADFVSAQFTGGGPVKFRDAQFTGHASFRGAQFTGDAYFRDARFTHGADFEGTQFTGWAHFWGAQFTDDVTDFRDAQFTGRTDFRDARFTGATFDGAQFTDGAYFLGARFTSGASFDGARFTGGVADFQDTRFTGRSSFDGARVSSERATVWPPPGWTTRPVEPDSLEDPAYLYLTRVEDGNLPDS
jgi:uncharacterized protein YjbI with pentapeptide repeats